MKKSKKIIIGVVTGVIVCAIVGTLLGVFIPRLTKKSNINQLVSEQVKPADGKGNFLSYSTDQAITDQNYSVKLQSIEDFSLKALQQSDGYNAVIKGLTSNYIIQFWKNYKNSEAYKERFSEWEKEINKDWDNIVKDYKNRYGDKWEFYFQLEVLDPAGGNEVDWKRNKLVEKANSALDDYLFANFYISPLNQSGTDTITSYPSPLTNSIQDYLVSSQLVNGKNGFGTRNNIVFEPSKNEQQLNPNSLALAKFQEFVFMEWVKNELPIITSMTLWKHTDPTTIDNNGFKFFNTVLAEEIYKGNYNFPSTAPTPTPPVTPPTTGGSGTTTPTPNPAPSTPSGGAQLLNRAAREGEATDSGSSGSSEPQSQVGISASYKWQAFPIKQELSNSPTGELTENSTDKYLNFANDFNNNGWVNKYLLKGTGGGININVKYTDDSSTLYFIKLGGGSGSVFNTSYTQYAAGSNYKFNEILGQPLDTNVPIKPATLDIDPIIANKSGTEIMNNFMEATKPASGYYVEIPQQVQAIINDSTDATSGYVFKGLYNGMKYTTDTVDLQNTPFILTRNESGVHIIGIDRAQAISEGYKLHKYEGMINEIANTILWRYVLTTSGMNGADYLNNGFSSFDVPNEIKNFFTNHRNELLFKYILQNEITPPTNPKEYIFSNEFTSIDPKYYLSTNTFKDYINAWIDYNNFKSNVDHNTTVRDKIIDIQKTKNSLTYKTYGNTVIQNGISAMQPYTRNITANGLVSRTNEGYVDNVYGMYNSLNLVAPSASDLTTATIDFNAYNDTNLKRKLDAIETNANNVYNSLKPEIGMKTLTYSSAKYNQYLLIGSKNPTSDMYYSDNCSLINDAVSSYIGSHSSDIENIINIQRLLASANYDPTKATNKPTTKVVNKDDVLDINNLALTGAYSDVITPNAAPSMPTTNTESSKLFVNYYLQKGFDIVNKVQPAIVDLWQYQGGVSTYDQLLQLARNKWAEPLLKNVYSNGILEYIKQVLGLKYAFDFNQDTGEYKFTKFKKYLIQQTEHNKKAAFVWVKTDRNDLINNYDNQTLEQRFSYKPNQIANITDVNGYIYQNAPTLATYKDNTTNLFNDTVTFDESNSRYVMAPIDNSATSKPFSGFQGMVFESSNIADVPSSAKEALFKKDLYVYNAQANGTVDTTTTVERGSMYNVGSVENLKKEINDNIYSFDSVIKTCNWLTNTFGIITNGAVSQTNVSDAKKDIIKLIDDNYGVGKKINPDIFALNKGSVLATGPSKYGASAYFKDSTAYGTKQSQVVFTQFNYEDVVKLFDTDGNNLLDEKDEGINWAYASVNGFLNTSVEAFFISAIQWFNTQTSYITSATNDAQDLQGKFDAFDRRLNNLFGKDRIANYKKEN